MLGAVLHHVVAHRLEEQLFVILVLHIDEIHDDDPADVAQAQLAGDLFRRFQIDGEHRRFLVGRRDFMTAVHIDDVHRFRMLDDEVGPAGHGRRFTERSFYLPVDAMLFEDGFAALVMGYDLDLIGCDGGEELFGIIKHILVVGDDLIKGIGQQVPQDAGGLVEFAQ